VVRHAAAPGDRAARLRRITRLSGPVDRFAGLSLVVLLLALAGCASTPTPTATPPAEPTPAVTAQTSLPASPALPAAGPPYPDPLWDVVVYDYAGVLSPATEASASEIILGVEQLTGAEVVVYTQVKPEATTASTERDAIALLEQWGVGRAGIDDGLVILFNLDDTLCHGQVELYAGPGYRADYLSNSDRQRIFEEDMVPLLRECDMGGAVLIALERVDEKAREVGPLD
jgi:uncharacterized membrane protein YgcG